jgi:hypothetical protein
MYPQSNYSVEVFFCWVAIQFRILSLHSELLLAIRQCRSGKGSLFFLAPERIVPFNKHRKKE